MILIVLAFVVLIAGVKWKRRQNAARVVAGIKTHNGASTRARATPAIENPTYSSPSHVITLTAAAGEGGYEIPFESPGVTLATPQLQKNVIYQAPSTVAYGALDPATMYASSSPQQAKHYDHIAASDRAMYAEPHSAAVGVVYAAPPPAGSPGVVYAPVVYADPDVLPGRNDSGC